MADGADAAVWRVAAAASQLPVPENVAVKDPAQWTIIGKPVKRLDTVDKLSGRQVFAIDLQLPDMLNATIAQCPVFGGKLKSFDAGGARRCRGCGMCWRWATTRSRWWPTSSTRPRLALAKLPIVWDEGAHAGEQRQHRGKSAGRGAGRCKQVGVGLKQGDVAAGASPGRPRRSRRVTARRS